MSSEELKRLIPSLNPNNERKFLDTVSRFQTSVEEAVPVLIEALETPLTLKSNGKPDLDKEYVREGVIQAMGRIGGEGFVQPLIAFLKRTREENWMNKVAMEGQVVNALRNIGGKEVKEFFEADRGNMAGMMSSMAVRSFLSSYTGPA